MGIISTLDKMRLKVSVPKQVREAADQMWQAVLHGATFEVPISLKKDDITMQAVWLLFRLHPEMKQIIRQSRSFIITHPSRLQLTPETQELMRKGGQFGDLKTFHADIASMLAGQEAFLNQQGIDPVQAEKEAQEASAKKHAMGEVAPDGSLTLPVADAELGNVLTLVQPMPHAGSPVVEEPSPAPAVEPEPFTTTTPHVDVSSPIDSSPQHETVHSHHSHD